MTNLDIGSFHESQLAGRPPARVERKRRRDKESGDAEWGVTASQMLYVNRECGGAADVVRVVGGAVARSSLPASAAAAAAATASASASGVGGAPPLNDPMGLAPLSYRLWREFDLSKDMSTQVSRRRCRRWPAVGAL
jgi:hypothetical protein